MKKLYILFVFIFVSITTISAQFGGGNRIWYRDADADSYGSSTNTTYASYPPSGYVYRAGDCNDNDSNINPDSSELCNGKDDNCNGVVDENVLSIPGVPSITNNCGNTVLTKPSHTGAITLYWQSSASGTSTSNSSNSITRTSGTVYYIRGKTNSGNCWSPVRSVTYSVSVKPPMPSTPTVTKYCGSTRLTRGNPPSGVTWYWQSSSSGTSTSNSSGYVTRTSGSVYYLRARYNGSGCWSNVRSVSYSINYAPSTPSTPSIVNNCGSTRLTKANSPSGVTWYWQSSSTGTSTSNSSASVTRTSGTNYYLRARNNLSACWGTVRTITYSINTIPSIPSAATVTNSCSSTRLTRSTPPSGITWYWQSSSSGTSTSNSSVSITRTSGVQYYLRSRNNNSLCWGSSRSVSYTINSAPVWYLDADGDGFGDVNSTLTQCTQPAGYVSNGDDQCPSIAGTSSGCNVNSQGVQLTDENHVFTRTYQTPMTNSSTINSRNDVIEQVTYFDGLGRVKQNISIQAGKVSPAANLESVSEWHMDWTEGTGSTPFYNRIGLSLENERLNGIDPSGKMSLLWKCGNDADHNADGGWNTDYFNVDKNASYRYTVWVKRTGSQNGRTYHGTQNVNKLDGTANNNPYFWNGDLPVLNQWYLLVGVIHPHGYGGEDSNVSGVYDINGNKVLDGTEYKWQSTTTTTRFRSYLYYSTDVNTAQYFWSPMVQKLNGTEASIADIIQEVQDKPTSNLESIPEWRMDWTEGTGSTPFYNRIGLNSENERLNGVDPSDKMSLLWKCGNDADHNADGGWNTDYFNVDKNASYRYTVWVKRTGSQNGTTYHGTQNVNKLDGTVHSNPYFWNGDLPVLNQWYLLVGVIHPHGYSGGDSHASGVYDINGNKVLDGTEYKWQSTTTTTRFRSYLYYSTDVNTAQYFWNPAVQRLDGTEANIADIIQETQDKAQDIIVHSEYDQYGRQSKQFLPYPANGTSGSLRTSNQVQATQAYYQTKHAEDFVGISLANVNPFSQTEYEESPLNRPLRQSAPGKEWAIGSGHEIKLEYATNSGNEVRYFKVNFTSNDSKRPILIEQGYYSAEELIKNITKDENWNSSDGNNHTTEEFMDKRGQVILKRTYNNNEPHNTHYVYDKYGNLTFVIPPKAADNISINSTMLNELCYQYKYDHRNRLIEKKIPGKGWESIVYNNLNQPILTQDANLKSTNQWLFTKYDAFGRVAYTGIMTRNTSRSTLQSEANSVSTAWVTRSGTINLGGASINYNNGGYPTSNITKVQTINYYDNYSFDLDGGNNPSTIYGENIITDVKGLATGSKSRIIGTNYWITSVTYYDKKSRPIYVYSRNDYLGNTDKIESKLDFIGRLVETKTTHSKDSQPAIVTVDFFSYDHTGRLVKQLKQINDGPKEMIAVNSYDALGQLERKGLGSKDGSQNTQVVNYDYNVRGWLTDINDVTNSANDFFSFHLGYTETSKPLYNGNISTTEWRTYNMDSDNKSYEYTYDALNRIKTGISNDARYDLSLVTYDKNGNIEQLKRRGHTNDAATTFGAMDDLTYAIDAGNKLLSVRDDASDSQGFKDGNTNGNDYVYDVNGNMIVDKNKGITNIVYNHLNLPTRIEFGSAIKNIEYHYDAVGTKMRKRVNDAGVIKTTDYVGSHIYENDELQLFFHAEGFVEPTGDAARPWEYLYYLKDHLGNNRVVFSSDPKEIEFKATMETSAAGEEETLFNNLPDTRVSFTAAAQSPTKVARLNSQNPIGPALSLPVGAGDTVRMEAFAYYEGGNGYSNTSSLASFIASVAGSFGGISGGTEAQQLTYNAFDNAYGIIGMQGSSTDNVPAAYLNYILFDQNMAYKTSGFKQVTNAANFSKEQLTFDDIVIDQSGFIYCFVSFESTAGTVYWDDFKVTMSKHNVREMTDYYPFGLKYNVYNNVMNEVENNYMTYNGKELEESLKLDWYDYGNRNYDASLGRFMSLDLYTHNYMKYSPYGYVLNNPISNIDYKGKFVLPKEFVEKYGRLAHYLKNDIQDILNNKKIVNGLKKFGGFTDAQLKEAFTYGKGPTINIDQLDDMQGSSGLEMFGLYLGGSSFDIDVDLVEGLENASGRDRDYLLFLTAVTIMHEFVHLGYTNNGLYDSENFDPTYEEGNEFEKAVYGKVFNRKEVKDFINKYLEEQKKKEQESQKKEESFNNLINNFDLLESGRYEWNGEEFVKTD